MTTRVSIRELRNQTSKVISTVGSGEVIITNHGKDVAVLRAIPNEWGSLFDQIEAELPAPLDTGWLDELASDDLASMDDLR